MSPVTPPSIEDRVFLWLVLAISLAFAWILWPFSGAVLWGVIVAILFAPLHRRLVSAMGQRRNLAALSTVAIVVVMVILPLTMVATSLVQEATGLYRRVESGELSISAYFAQVVDALPAWAVQLLDRVGLTSLGVIQERLSEALTRGGQALAARAIQIGQNAFDFLVSLFVMLYLLFFLLRDGDALARRIRTAVPMHREHQEALLERFAVVIRATVKGNVVVALLQGALGGLIFWPLGIRAPLLWGVLMAILSLLPAVGAGLVWAPVAVYFLATGAVWRGILLIAYGALVIGLVDNVVRPILVGKDTRMPDYVVLISTLGGIAVLGFNGFVIGPVIAALFMAAWDIFGGAEASRSATGDDR